MNRCQKVERTKARKINLNKWKIKIMKHNQGLLKRMNAKNGE